jgi:hypothetical protein
VVEKDTFHEDEQTVKIERDINLDKTNPVDNHNVDPDNEKQKQKETTLLFSHISKDITQYVLWTYF